MYSVTHDFIIARVKTLRKRLGDKPVSLNISQNPRCLAAILTNSCFSKIAFTLTFKSARVCCHFRGNKIFYQMISLSYFMLVTMTILSKNHFFFSFFFSFSQKLNITKFRFFRIAKYFCGIDLKLTSKLFEYNIDIV